MADVSIPSPTVFLRNSPPPAPAPQPAAPKHGRRPSSAQEKKKKAQRKASASAGDANGATVGSSVVKPKQSKSRNGCLTCKAKRLKCGEEKPSCQQCAKRNVECGGYKKDFKWRPFEETNVKQHIDRQRRANSPKRASAPSSAGASKQPTPDVSFALQAAGLDERQSVDDDARLKRDSVMTNASPESTQVSPRSTRSKGSRPSSVGQASLITTIREAPLPTDSPEDASPDEELDAATPRPGNMPMDVLPSVSRSPTLTDMLMPFGGNANQASDLLDFQLPDNFNLGTADEPVIDPSLTEGNMNIEDVPRIGENGMPVNAYIYPQPYFAEDSPEMLTFRFDRMTCGILSLMDGPHENPWRTLVWPLTSQSPGLYHAIMAMTAFHSMADIPSLRVVGHEHKDRSLRFIREGVRDNSMGKQIAIATALALGFAESWDQHTSTGNVHIKGAQTLVKQALEIHGNTPLMNEDLARLKFLCNAWVYMDVISRLTSVESDESNDFDNTFLFSGGPNDCPPLVMGIQNVGFGIDFGMPIDAKLDPFMGCANTLFPLIGRVANLVRKVCRSLVNSPAVISEANDLKTALESWDPPDFIEPPEDPSTDVPHTLQTAEAYRWATLLHLHQSVPELPSLSSAELAQRVLQYLATVPMASRTTVVQIYPLMVASCEATSDEDRLWVRLRWAAMYQRMRIGILEKCSTVVEEVWRRRDNYAAQPTSNRRLVATAELQPSRGRGQPLQRTATGSLRLGDPGRTGVVFSYIEGDEDAYHSDENEQKKRARERRNGRDPRMGVMDPAYTVRGHLHWVGVMWDWGWESRLSQ